jgi:cytochrome c-type biogenesis protein
MDPAAGVGIPVAFGAGLISFLSPCVLPLVPGYIASVAGVSATSEIKARRVIGPSLAFVGSFSAIYIAFGLLGQQALRGTLTGVTAQHVCGAIIILLGLLFLLSPFVPMLSKDWHLPALMNRAGRTGPVLTGIAFAVAWTPCSGPTLGAIISAAGLSSSATHGAFLLAIYCAGLGVPFLITALAFGKATSALAVVKRHYPVVIGVGGIVLVSMGFLILTGHFSTLNTHVNNALHELG